MRLPNLDTLRFISAALVMLQHIELYKASFYGDSFWNISFFRIIGCFGVALFFVLSSFLITTLLLNEQKNNGSISLKRFYFKRIFRIWPLYYLIIFLGFFIFPNLSFFQFSTAQGQFTYALKYAYTPNLLLYAFGLSSLARTLFGDIAFVSHTWTLTTEQLFYFVWPLVLMLISKRQLISVMLILLCYHVFRYFLVTKYAYALPYNRYILSFFSGLYIQCMCYGAIFAIIKSTESKWLSLLYHPFLFYSSIILAILFTFFIHDFEIYHYDLFSVLFGVIILNLATNTKYSQLLENKTTNYLGSISYGIYMFHPILIFISIKLALFFKSMLLIYIFTIFGTIFISHLSFNYFEIFFTTKPLAIVSRITGYVNKTKVKIYNN